MSLKGVAKETLEIVARGDYVAPSGATVVVRELVERAVSGTVLHRPDELQALVAGRTSGGGAAPAIELTPETTAAAARRLVETEGVTGVVALNFASAKNP